MSKAHKSMLMFKAHKSILIQCSVLVLLVVIGVAGRLLPHEPNFTPVAAAALFAGFFMGRVWIAVFVPLAIMMISDAFLGRYDFYIMGAVYLGMLSPLLFRPLLRRRPAAWSVAVSAVGSSVAFFAISNLAVWVFSGMYPPTWSGLVECYTLALPFFRNTLAGNAFWSVVFFGTYAMCVVLARSVSTIRQRAA